MDVSTAKTLVSLLLVSAIVLFSAHAVRTFVVEVARDLKAGRAQRAAAAEAPQAD